MIEIRRDFRGYLNINKPKGPSSFDVVRDLRRQLDEKRVGHAGTLDPLASGVLVVAVGRENTKNISKIQEFKKTYVATIKLGITSETDDAEGSLTPVDVKKIPDISEVKRCVKAFTGEISQTPPAFSAKKVNGQRAYDLSRKGKVVDLNPCDITIHNIKIANYAWPYLKIEVTCSRGTYIRSLARDIGSCLKTGAYLCELIRTSVGEYKIKDSIKI